MILDRLLMFSEKQSISGNAGNTDSTNAIDLNLGQFARGEPFGVGIVVTTAPTAGTTLTVAVNSGSGVSGGGSINAGSRTEVSLAIPRGQLTAGARFLLPLPVVPRGYQRYLELNYARSGNFNGGGAVSAMLLPVSYFDTWLTFVDATN